MAQVNYLDPRSGKAIMSRRLLVARSEEFPTTDSHSAAHQLHRRSNDVMVPSVRLARCDRERQRTITRMVSGVRV